MKLFKIVLLIFIIVFTINCSAQSSINAPETNTYLSDSTQVLIKEGRKVYHTRLDSLIDKILGNSLNLQEAYNNSPSPQIIVDSATEPLVFRGNNINNKIFEVQKTDGSAIFEINPFSVLLTDVGLGIGSSANFNEYVDINTNSISVLYGGANKASIGMGNNTPQFTLREGGFNTIIKNEVTPTQTNDIRVQNGSGILAFKSDIVGGVTDHALLSNVTTSQHHIKTIDTDTNLQIATGLEIDAKIDNTKAISPMGLSNSQIQADVDNNTTHTARTDNPHLVTALQVGLGNVDNTSDLNKPISTATQTALDLKLGEGINNITNQLYFLGNNGSAISLLPDTALMTSGNSVTFLANSTQIIMQNGLANTSLSLENGGNIYFKLGATSSVSGQVLGAVDNFNKLGWITPSSGVTNHDFLSNVTTSQHHVKTVDTDTNLDLAGVQALGFVTGSHTIDTNTQLSQAQVGTFATNEGFIKQSDLATNEWSNSTGTRAGANLLVSIGDYDASNSGTILVVDDGNEVIDLFSNGDIKLSSNTLKINLISGINPIVGQSLKVGSAIGGEATMTWGNNDLINDLTPQLGGNLDANGKNITNVNYVAVNDYIQLSNAVKVSRIFDEDNLGSNDNTALATQQSIKKYVDDTSIILSNQILAKEDKPNPLENQTAIDLSNTIGLKINQAASNPTDIYTILAGSVVGGKASVYYNSTGDIAFPTITGATNIDGSAFEVGVNYQIHVDNYGGSVGVLYYFDRTDNLPIVSNNYRSKNTGIISLSDTGGVNVNIAATNNLMTWDISTEKDTNEFTHSTVTNPSRITITNDGVYDISGTIVVEEHITANLRYNGAINLRLNGVTVVNGNPQGGYLRMSNGQETTSLDFTYKLSLNAGDYIEFLVDRACVTNVIIGTLPNASRLDIVRL